ncbi:hypothetical protein [Streptosporangium roseum]|uniref:hypothetical protein n=1 Tax=Streptosporangium roseum TaxID=2001 RepID=UPI003322BB3C
MDVAPDDLKSTISRAFDTEGGELGRALVAKMNELLAVGNFWGDDSTGAKFYNGDADLPGYASMVEGVATEASAISLFYVQVGDRLHDMGRNVEVAEWRTIGEMPRVPE